MDVRTHAVALGAASLLALAGPAYAQAFADLKTSAVNYAVASAEPRMTCAALATAFKDKDLVSLKTMAIAASGNAPDHCRVSGVLSPEIGFEVNLPARWNQRLYMIGNVESSLSR